MKIIMITAPFSNTGKSLITLGIVRMLKNMGMDVSAFKVEPDFFRCKVSKFGFREKGRKFRFVYAKRGRDRNCFSYE
mgnify:FL=1